VAEFPARNSYIAMMAWFSRNSPRGRFHNETIAQPLGLISKTTRTKFSNWIGKKSVLKEAFY